MAHGPVEILSFPSYDGSLDLSIVLGQFTRGYLSISHSSPWNYPSLIMKLSKLTFFSFKCWPYHKPTFSESKKSGSFLIAPLIPLITNINTIIKNKLITIKLVGKPPPGPAARPGWCCKDSLPAPRGPTWRRGSHHLRRLSTSIDVDGPWKSWMVPSWLTQLELHQDLWILMVVHGMINEQTELGGHHLVPSSHLLFHQKNNMKGWMMDEGFWIYFNWRHLEDETWPKKQVASMQTIMDYPNGLWCCYYLPVSQESSCSWTKSWRKVVSTYTDSLLCKSPHSDDPIMSCI